MTDPLIQVAMVGHTNTGKTSLLRTLTRDAHFGDIANRASTTRHVEGAALLVDGQSMIAFYDTPGLEDSISLLEHLEQCAEPQDWVARIEQFLDREDAQHAFAQEAKSLRQIVACDVVIYVIDVREQVLGKYRDELTLLIRTARPVIPLLNFIDSPAARTEQWRQHLIRLGLHASLGFNPLISDAEAERRLFEKMRALNDVLYEPLGQVITDLEQRRCRLRRIAADLIADLLIDVAAYAPPVAKDNAHALEAVHKQMAAQVREREWHCAREMLKTFGFNPKDYAPEEILIHTAADDHTWLTLASLKHLGIRSSSGVAAGASAGLATDLLVGGLSLGVGTATGATLGGLYQLRAQSRLLMMHLRGNTPVYVSNETLYQLAARQLTLADGLLRRGHAAVQPLRLEATVLQQYRQRIQPTPPAVLAQARVTPSWSGLIDPALGSGRETAREQLTTALEALLEYPQ